MNRRQFLKAGSFVTFSMVGMGLWGCSSSGGEAGPAIAGGSGWKFPQSVASGDPKPDGILLWTRVVPLSADDVTSSTHEDFSIQLRISESDASGLLGSNQALTEKLVLDTRIPVQQAYDHTVRHKVSGLGSGKTYYYQFVAGDVRSKVGRFKTAPAKDADVSQLKLAFLSCQDWSVNHWGAYAHLAANENLDFIVHLGDYVYETVGEAFQTGAVEARHGALQLPDGVFKSGTSGAKYANTLADYRYLYKRYRTDSRLQAVHERFAMVAVWDDHEFSDDCWGDAETYTNGSVSNAGGDNARQTNRRRSANQAWFEFMPADVFFDGKATGFDNIRIYRELQFGKLAHLVMTDERLYRSDHVIPEATVNPATGQVLGSTGSRYMVPETTLAAVEGQKMAAGKAAGDELALVSILGRTQRDWWKQTMQTSTATWKLWGNEVSLLKMGLDGAKAIATLTSLNFIPTLAANIASTATQTGGNQAVAAAIVAAVAAGASSTVAASGAGAIATTDASGGSGAEKAAAAVGAGLSAQQADLAIAVFDTCKAAALSGASASQQQNSGALKIGELLTGQSGLAAVMGAVQADIITNKQNSVFIPASMKASLGPFFDRFVLNADQWDGFNAERKALMQHLVSAGIKNVVALTGDIHAFYAGTVQNDYAAANGGTPVMVDLVTAGVSSDSFFSYLKDAVNALSSSLATLVYYPLGIPVPGVGTVNLNVNLLDYTLRAAQVTPASVAGSLQVQLRSELAAKGLPENQLDGLVGAVLAGLQSDAAFVGQLVPLAQTLASLNSNPWLKLASTDAQGYAVVTITPTKLTCEFRQVNRLVGTNAPVSVLAKTMTATVTKDVPDVVIS